MTNTKMQSELKEGQIVRNYGKEFMLPMFANDQNFNKYKEVVWTYTGICTDSPVNDDIRDTGFNGSSYSWRASDGKLK